MKFTKYGKFHNGTEMKQNQNIWTFMKNSTKKNAIAKILLVISIIAISMCQNIVAKNQNNSPARNTSMRFVDFGGLDSASLANIIPKNTITKKQGKSKTPPTPLLTMNNFNFDLEAWLPRLVQIVNSTDGSFFSVGVCGTCLLQAYEMAAEILHYGNTPPTQEGYFFTPAPHTNPFTDFRQRHSILYSTMVDIVEYYVIPASNPQERFANSARVAYASAISLLPQYNWRFLGYGTTQSEIRQILGQILQGSVGSLYITSTTHRSSAGVDTYHSVLLVRTSGGVRVLQTNVTGAPDYYLRHIARENATIQSLQESLVQVGVPNSQLIMLGVSQVNGSYAIPFASALSFSDCSGEGDSRRGNARIPTASTLNQCTSGRCNQ